jgi:predicted nucleic-acid-binding protein
MTGLDTNVLVRFLTQDEPGQSRKANASLERDAAAGERCFIGCIVLCELVWVLQGAYGYGKKDLVSVLEKILSTIEFEIEDKEIVYQALSSYRQGSGDFADYFIGWRNRQAGCKKTISFDRDLRDCDLFAVL